METGRINSNKKLIQHITWGRRGTYSIAVVVTTHLALRIVNTTAGTDEVGHSRRRTDVEAVAIEGVKDVLPFKGAVWDAEVTVLVAEGVIILAVPGLEVVPGGFRGTSLLQHVTIAETDEVGGTEFRVWLHRTGVADVAVWHARVAKVAAETGDASADGVTAGDSVVGVEELTVRTFYRIVGRHHDTWGKRKNTRRTLY